jgi:hypothetical protein
VKRTAVVVAAVICASMVGMPPVSAAAVPCSGPPIQSAAVTETVTSSSNTTIPGGVKIASAASVAVIGAPASNPNVKAWGVQFDVAGTKNVEFLVYARPGAAWNLWVDDRPAADIPRTTPLTENEQNLIKFTLPDAGAHNIRFYMNNVSLVTIFGDPGSTASSKPVGGPRVFFLGDSLTEGTRQSTGGGLGSWIWRFGAMCGFVDIWNGGVGSTGAIADNHGAGANYVTRASTVVAGANPDIVFITSYYNDRNWAATDIANAFASTIDAIAALPAKPTIVVTGSYDPLGVNGAPYDSIDAAILAACTARGVPYIEPATGAVYDGRGKRLGGGGPWITADNRAAFIGSDNVHQTDAGQKYMAQRMFEAFSLLQGQGGP